MITTRNDGASNDVVKVACDEYPLITANYELVGLHSDSGGIFKKRQGCNDLLERRSFISHGL